MHLALVVPGGLGSPSGGSIYNEKLAAALAAAGHQVTVHPVPGPWPHAGPSDHRALAAALGQHAGRPGAVVLVDGLMASTAPDAVRSAVNTGNTVWVLLHLPLPAETGLIRQEMDAFAALEAEALRHATGVICTSNWARQDLLARYSLDRVHVVPPGTEAAQTATGSHPPHLLMLGSLTPRKNHSLVLSALTSVADLPWTAALVGGPVTSTYAAMLADRITGDFAPGRVGLTGVLQGQTLDVQWDRTNLVLLPSIAETFGMAVTEGLSRGIPAVVGEATGAVEALTGNTPGAPLPGAVVNPSNPDQLARLLRRWLTDSTVSQSWRNAALGRRDTLPTWANTATTLLTVLDS